MTVALLLLPLLASGVAAQIPLPVIDMAVVDQAVNPTDPAYTICVAVNSLVQGCVKKVGGQQALATANPIKLAECACCVGPTVVAGAYSQCSAYLATEAPSLSSQYSAYGYIYSVCGVNSEICQGQTAASATAAPTPPPASPSPSATQRNTSPPPTNTPVSGSASGSATTLAPACSSMLGLYDSCIAQTPGFSSLPFGKQAPCYCCRTMGDQVSWTDQLDKYAQTCRDLESTGNPTAYSVAKTFATFCEKFSDACSPTPTPAPTSDDSNAPSAGGGAQLTVTTTSKSNSAAGFTVRVGCATGVALVAALVVIF